MAAMALLRAAAAALAATLVACGGGSNTPSVEKPFTGWVGVGGMRCADGSATGVGISPGTSDPDKVLVYLAPGGACWSTGACSTTVPRAFGSAEYTILKAFAAGTIFDRTLAGNPFRTWTQVFVPYCTGDVHAGDTVRVHGGVTWEHHGWKNLQAAVATFTGVLQRPTHLVVAGSSAGGYGALAAYDLVRAEWDPAGGTTAALLDDSGPTFDATGLPSTLLARWWDVWGLGSTIGTRCPACETNLAAVWSGLHARHPADRLALLSTTQDQTMRGFFADPELAISAQTGAEFEAHLDAFVQSLGTLGPQVAAYRVGGTTERTRHALLADAFFLGNTQGRALLDWVSQLTALDPAWASSTSL
jgi:hypothetical protein